MGRVVKSTTVASQSHNLSEGGVTGMPDWAGIRGDANLQGVLNDSIREKIGALNKAKPQNNLAQSINSFVSQVLHSGLLDRAALSPALTTLYEQQLQIYRSANIPKKLRTRQYICASGLVLSPDHCVTTIRDTQRVGLFLRGVDGAIKKLKKHNSTKPIHIAYPACGPFAPLLLPLLAYYNNAGLYSAGDINVTFIDIQEGAVVGLDCLVNALGLQEYVKNIVCADACEYQPQDEIHLVVLEAMQHGFSREGHLRLAKHYANLLGDNGILLPKKIAVTASLTVAQSEYVDQWHTQDTALQQELRQQRLELGDVLNVDLPFLRSMQEKQLDEYTQLVECATLTIPILDQGDNEKTLLFHTRVNVFDDDWLGEYESGITHPLPDAQVCVNFTPRDARLGDLLVNSGDRITFYYCMNGLPGFLAIKATGSNASEYYSCDSTGEDEEVLVNINAK